jgi:hypothetical protein
MYRCIDRSASNDSTRRQLSIGLHRLSATLELNPSNGCSHAENTPDASSDQRRPVDHERSLARAIASATGTRLSAAYDRQGVLRPAPT